MPGCYGNTVYKMESVAVYISGDTIYCPPGYLPPGHLPRMVICPQDICPPDICPGWSFVPRTFAPIALYRWEVVSERKMFGGQISATRAYHRPRPYALCTTGGCPQATKAHIKMNARKLYQADGYAVKELLKVASLLYNAVRMKTAGGSGDADNHNHNVSFDISSKVTELLCHSIRHSFNKSIKQSINQSINQSMKQSINEAINQASKQSSNQATNQPRCLCHSGELTMGLSFTSLGGGHGWH